MTDTTYSAATTSAAGLMSASDKTKLNGIASGATANTGTVIGSNLTDGYFVMGNGGVNVDISTMKPTTSSTS